MVSVNSYPTQPEVSRLSKNCYLQTCPGFRIFDHSDQPNKRMILFQKVVCLIKEDKLKNLKRLNKFSLYQVDFGEEHLM